MLNYLVSSLPFPLALRHSDLHYFIFTASLWGRDMFPLAILILSGLPQKHCPLFYAVHDIRGGCWWDGSRNWTFPPAFAYMLLLCDRWRHRGSLIERHVAWECGWSESVSLNPSMWGKKTNGTHWHSSMLAEHLWSPNGGCEVMVFSMTCSAVATVRVDQHLHWCR